MLVLLFVTIKQIGYMLLLNTNRKSYMGSPMLPQYLTMDNLGLSKSLRFEHDEGAELGYYVTMTH